MCVAILALSKEGTREEDRELSLGPCSWAAGDPCTEEEMEMEIEMEMERGLP